MSEGHRNSERRRGVASRRLFMVALLPKKTVVTAMMVLWSWCDGVHDITRRARNPLPFLHFLRARAFGPVTRPAPIIR
jgi:hypothetical protein